MLEPAHIVGISKTGYVLATPRCLDWRHALPGTGTSNDPSDSDSLDPCRRPAGRRRGDRRALGSQLLASSSSTAPSSRRPHHPSAFLSASAVTCRDARGEADGAVPDRTTVFDDEVPGIAKLDPLSSVPCAGRYGCRGRRGRVRRRQRLAFTGVPGTPTRRGDLEVRLGRASCPLGGHPRHVCARVGGRGRHRARRCRSVAVRAWRRVRAVPDLRQRALALRTSPRSHRSRLPADVRRPYARPEDAAVTMRHERRRKRGDGAGWDVGPSARRRGWVSALGVTTPCSLRGR